MSKDEVFDWWGGNYIKIPSDGERIEKYRDIKNHMIIYFSDLVNSEKIDSIEFEDAVDINGIRVGMAYSELEKALPKDYTKGVDGTIQFMYNDFYITIVPVSYEDTEVALIKIARSIHLKSIQPLSEMSMEDLVRNYGGDYNLYDDGTENYVNGYFGFTLERWGDSLQYYSIYFPKDSFSNDCRMDISGARVGLSNKEILNILGEPFFQGQFIQGDNMIPIGELLVYEILEGQVCFYSYERGGDCYSVEYHNWVADNFIKPDAKIKEDIFNLSDCEIGRVKLGDTDKQVRKIKGEPQSIDDWYFDGKVYGYDSVEYCFVNSDADELILNQIIFTTDQTQGPRGIKVGDSINDVVSKFYSNYTIEEMAYDKLWNLYDNGYFVRGFIGFNYASGEIDRILYSYLDKENTVSLKIDIENGIVIKMVLNKCLADMELFPWDA